MYYVYVHIRLDNDEIFYVGKGSNNRAFSTLNRNKYWLNIVNKCGYRVEILERNLSESDAFVKEMQLIKSLDPVTNMTAGGDGGDTWSRMSEKDKKRLRDSAKQRSNMPNSGVAKAAQKRKGQTKDTCGALKRMAEANSRAFSGKGNPMHGRSHWDDKSKEEKCSIKRSISETLKATYKSNPRTYNKVTCPHCGKTGAKPGLTRYHFDNCKLK